jgi:hypothetical protein
MVRFSACAGASSQARGNSWRANPQRARRWHARGRVRALYAVCRSRLAVRGSRCRPALSVGRRRDLAFGSLTPPSHRKGRREKRKWEGLEGESVRGHGSQARSKEQTSEIVTAGCGWWFLLAPMTRHDAEERRVEKRHQTDGRRLGLLKPFLFTGRRWMQARPTRPDFHEPRRGAKTATQCGGKIEGAAVTETSEVGSHRVTAGEELAADWTDPPKRGRRRENAGSSGRFGKGRCVKSRGHTGSGNHRSNAGGRNVIPSGTVEHECTRVE